MFGSIYRFRRSSTPARLTKKVRRDAERPRTAMVEHLEGRKLLSGYTLTSGTLAYNGVAQASSVLSFKLRSDGAAYYLQNNQNFAVNYVGAGGSGSFSFGLVYKYGLRMDAGLPSGTGYAYYWLQSDSKLYLNTPSTNGAIDPNPVLGFGMRSDNYGYYWDSSDKLLYLNTPSANLQVDGTNPILGFGVRSDGLGYFWDSTNNKLQLNTPTGYILVSNSIEGFGMRSDNYAYFWDSSTGDLWVNTPASNIGPLGGTTVSAFAADSSGVGYYVETGTSTVRKNTPPQDVPLESTYISGTLANSGPGGISAVSFEATVNSNTSLITRANLVNGQGIFDLLGKRLAKPKLRPHRVSNPHRDD
jgi:hypothetical protein